MVHLDHQKKTRQLKDVNEFVIIQHTVVGGLLSVSDNPYYQLVIILMAA